MSVGLIGFAAFCFFFFTFLFAAGIIIGNDSLPAFALVGLIIASGIVIATICSHFIVSMFS